MITFEFKASPMLQKKLTALQKIADEGVEVGYFAEDVPTDLLTKTNLQVLIPALLEYRAEGGTPGGAEVWSHWAVGPQYRTWGFMRATLERIKPLVVKRLMELGAMDPDKMWETFALWVKKEIVDSIWDVRSPGLRPSTIRKKKSHLSRLRAEPEKPLIEFGTMVDSIAYEIISRGKRAKE